MESINKYSLSTELLTVVKLRIVFVNVLNCSELLVVVPKPGRTGSAYVKLFGLTHLNKRLFL